MKHTFCRTYLAIVMIDIRKTVSVETIKSAWTIKTSLGGIEFHINKCKAVPEGFYWYGSACCCWEGRALGWQAYIEHRKNNGETT